MLLIQRELFLCSLFIAAVIAVVPLGPQLHWLLAVLARLRELRETLLQRNTKHFHVHQVRVALAEHPEVVGEDDAGDEVYEVVSAEADHQAHLQESGDCREPREAVPADGREL